jgi:hypothetical protein
MINIQTPVTKIKNNLKYSQPAAIVYTPTCTAYVFDDNVYLSLHTFLYLILPEDVLFNPKHLGQ